MHIPANLLPLLSPVITLPGFTHQPTNSPLPPVHDPCPFFIIPLNLFLFSFNFMIRTALENKRQWEMRGF